MLARRLLILLAVLMGLTALASGVAPREQQTREEPRSAASPAPSRAGEPETLEVTISASAGAEPRRVRVRIGQTVHLTVEGDVVDAVQLGDLEIEPIEPASPALLELLADEPGEVPITLVDAQRQIGVLDVRE